MPQIVYQAAATADPSDSAIPPQRWFLAEGDSWFSFGQVPPPLYGNLVAAAQLRDDALWVNCAQPSAEVVTMAARRDEDPYFAQLVGPGPLGWRWAAVWLSGGGNDLFEALRIGPIGKDGLPRPLADRLLLTPAEAAAAGSPTHYLSEPGWTRFSSYLAASFSLLVDLAQSGQSAGRPVVAHTYAVPTARPAGVLGKPAWIEPSLRAYGIPPQDWQAVTAAGFARLRDLLLGLSARLPHFHVFDSSAVPLTPAAPGSTGRSGDWANEIHLTPKGYRKVGAVMGPWFEALLNRYDP